MLTYFFKKLIEAYWKHVPESNRKICIYKLTCSKAVYQALQNKGFWSASKLYLFRRFNCKNGYTISWNSDNSKVVIQTKMGSIINEEEINPLLVSEFKLSQ